MVPPLHPPGTPLATALLKWYPIGRLGQPEDVASLAVYLASDEARFMTGSTLVIDGGLTAGTVLFGDV